MILPIYLYGQPVLRKVVAPVAADYPDLKKLIDDMFETLGKAQGVGLAAPQVGLAISLIVIDATAVADDFPECADFRRVMINPEITEKSDKTVSGDEGCLSIPGIFEAVPRAEWVTVRYQDADFVTHEETVHGWAARVVQHEYDHLGGHVFIDRISLIRKQLIRGKLNQIVSGKKHCAYKVRGIK